MSRIDKLKALSFYEWRLLAKSMLLLPVTAVSLKLLGVNRTQSWMRRSASILPPGPVPAKDQPAQVLLLARMVDMAARHGIYRANCLPRSLLLMCFLGRRDIECELKYGAHKRAGRFAAHAWVEHRGVALNEHDHSLWAGF